MAEIVLKRPFGDAENVYIREIKAPFTQQKIFGAAWMKVVRVPKK